VYKQLLAIALIGLIWTSSALAKPKHTVQRGAALVLETQWFPSVNVQAASLTWQTYDTLSPEQRHMATAFRCDANVVATTTGHTMSCKVPLDVADGNYYLTSIFIKTEDSERMYRWQDQAFYIDVQVKGGERVPPPYVLSVLLK